MNFTGMKKETTRYPAGYIANINEIYQQYDAELSTLAKVHPDDDKSDASDLMVHRLLKSQETLLELAGNMRVTSLTEASELLSLWHSVAIRDVSPYDVSLADGLILALHDYLVQPQPQPQTA